MNMKYREAKINLSKQTFPSKKLPDPLATLCAQKNRSYHKTKPICKTEKSNAFHQNRETKNSDKGTQFRSTEPSFQDSHRKPHKKDFEAKKEWLRYLPQDYDQFEDQRQIVKPLQNEKIYPSSTIMESEPNLEQITRTVNTFKPTEFNFEEFKKKIGVVVKQPELEVAVAQSVKKQETKQANYAVKNQSVLPFAGRPFEQAPPRPEPKKIYEYPPTCKVAGLYEWPQPRSQHRQWRSQMKEARKLN